MKKIIFICSLLITVGVNAQNDMWKFSSLKNNDCIYCDSVKYKPLSSIYPGCKPGEVFLQNISEEFYFDDEGHLQLNKYEALERNLDAMPWQSKRLGPVAYDRYGRYLPNFRPIFVLKEFVLKEKENCFDNSNWY